MIEKCCGGPPGEIPGVDKQYKDRSPIHFIASANDLPIAFFAGIHDGHRGSVPIRHSLDAFNQICIRNGDPVISEKEIQELSSRNGRLKNHNQWMKDMMRQFSVIFICRGILATLVY